MIFIRYFLIHDKGMMTFWLGCELSSKLTVIAPVIANMPEKNYTEL